MQLLDDENAAFQARVDLITGAQCSIDVSCFSVNNDDVSCAILSHLRAAARRGVRVRLVVDACFNAIPRGMQRHLTAVGVEIREYHRPRLLKSESVLCRLHDKIIVVDGQSVILGGRNISNAYFGDAGNRNYIDRDVVVTGHVGQHVDAYFHSLWNCRHVTPARVRNPLPALVPGKPWSTVCDVLTNLDHYRSASAEQSLDHCLQDHDPCCTRPARCRWQPLAVESGTIAFLHSRRPGDRHCCDVNDEIARLISEARCRVVIESPYFVLWDRMERVLKHVRERGVPVCILTNSIDTTDNLIVNAELTNQKHRLNRMGIRLFEYHGPGILHAKSMVIDDTAIIGSYNLNPRSDFYDTETVVTIHDRAAAEQLLESIGTHLSLSHRAERHRGIADHFFPPERAAPLKYATVQVMRLVSPFIRRHL